MDLISAADPRRPAFDRGGANPEILIPGR